MVLRRKYLTHNCSTEERDFDGTLGSGDFSGPDEYRIHVGRDNVDFDGEQNIYFSAEMTVGRRWGDHVQISFHDELSDDKTALLYGMRQMAADLADAIKYLENL